MTENKHSTKRKDERKGKNEHSKNKGAKGGQPGNFKYGPLPKFQGQSYWSRGITIIGVLIYVWYFAKSPKETTFARQGDVHNMRGQNLDCDPEYMEDIRNYPGCVPKTCGRFVTDKIVSSHEADLLLRLAQRVMALGGSSGGATVMDLHSGALSYDDKFINAYAQDKELLTPTDKVIYNMIRRKIQQAIAENFKIDVNGLYLTHPTFFSRLSNTPPKTIHDEYWHMHVDKQTYESFHYTSLLYLNNYGIDFKGGRFIFSDNLSNPQKNVTVEPRAGRVLMFSSGAENPHSVEKVTHGLRYAITVSFTCDKSRAIEDPLTGL